MSAESRELWNVLAYRWKALPAHMIQYLGHHLFVNFPTLIVANGANSLTMLVLEKMCGFIHICVLLINLVKPVSLLCAQTVTLGGYCWLA